MLSPQHWGGEYLHMCFEFIILFSQTSARELLSVIKYLQNN